MGVKSNTEKRPTKRVKERRGNQRTGIITLPSNQTWLKQPRLVTFMRGDFSIVMMRSLVVIVEQLQPAIEARLQKKPMEQLELFNTDANDIRMRIPIRNFGVTPQNYGLLKEALTMLATTPVEMDTVDPETGEEAWRISGLFTAIIPKDTHSRHIEIEMRKDIAKRFVEVEGGFTKYMKEIAFNTQSKYTIKIYLLISSWKDRGGFEITLKNFRKQLSLESKYPEYKDLYKRVIKPAYNELFEKSDVWFEMSETYNEGSNEPSKLTFKIIKGRLSPKEEQLLANSKKQIRLMLENNLRLDDAHITPIEGLVNIYNVKRAVEEVAELISYIKTNEQKIKNIPNFLYVSLKSNLSTIMDDMYDAPIGEDAEEQRR